MRAVLFCFIANIVLFQSTVAYAANTGDAVDYVDDGDDYDEHDEYDMLVLRRYAGNIYPRIWGA